MTRPIHRLLAVAASGVLVAGTVVCYPTAASASSVSDVRRFDVGSIEPGASTTVSVPMGDGDIAEASAGGMRTAAPGFGCPVAVTETSYGRSAAGERTVSVTVTNMDPYACTTVLYLAELTADRSGSFSDLEPGQTKTTLWHRAALNSKVYLAGVAPAVPASGTCQMRADTVTRASAGGELQFLWRVRNIGTVACSGQYFLGWLPVDQTHDLSGNTYEPGSSGSVFDVGFGAFRVYVVGFRPVPDSAGNCDFAPVQLAGIGDPAVQDYPTIDYSFRNSGGLTCALTKTTVALIR